MWIAHNPIPPEYGRWGAFNKLRAETSLALRGILESLESDDRQLDSESRKLRDFYRTAMDEEKIEKLNLVVPIREYHQNMIYVGAFTVGPTRKEVKKLV